MIDTTESGRPDVFGILLELEISFLRQATGKGQGFVQIHFPLFL